MSTYKMDKLQGFKISGNLLYVNCVLLSKMYNDYTNRNYEEKINKNNNRSWDQRKSAKKCNSFAMKKYIDVIANN